MAARRKNRSDNRSLKIIAHRGGAGEAFENSFESIQHAIKIGCDSVEVDLRQTQDGEIVVFHDETLDRTTDHSGKLRHYTAGDLKKIKLKNGARIPTLRELLRITKNKISLHLEVKERGFESQLVKMLGKLNSVRVISFNRAVLNKIHTLNPKIKTGFLFAKKTEFNRCPKFCALILPHWKLVNSKLILWAKENRKKIHAWTVNDRSAAKKLSRMGIDAVITNVPERLNQSPPKRGR